MEFVWKEENYKCPLCGRTGHGCVEGQAMVAILGYPVCSVGANNCLNKIIHGSKSSDIVGASLRCILKGTKLCLQGDICEYIGAFLRP